MKNESKNGVSGVGNRSAEDITRDSFITFAAVIVVIIMVAVAILTQ